MRRLVALHARASLEVVDRMRRIWDDGDAFLPLDPRLPGPAVEQLLAAMGPAALVDEHGEEHALAGGTPVLEGDAVVVPTSGSTGVPKGVIHTHESVAASARATNEGVGTDPTTDTWLCSLPLGHVAGLSVVFRSLTSGTRLLLLDGFDAAACEAAARHDGATLTTLVPTALARIDPSLFRRIVVGGTHPPDDLPENCVVSYGLTETGSAIAYDGRALHDAELSVVSGTVHVRGPMLLRAYRTIGPDGPGPDGVDPKDPDGWFDTGDVGELHDGVLTVHGRDGDLIITGGENVWPAAVEAVVRTHPGVTEVVVVGRPDPTWGQRVTAVVVPTDPARPPTLDEVRTHAKAVLPSYAAPGAIEIVAALPTTSLGKLLRRSV